MGWLFGKKSPPLVAGRDRLGRAADSRPAYSYYAARPSSSSTASKKTSGRLTTGGSAQPVRLSTYTLVVGVCTAVIIVCVVKLLLLVPNSKIVVTSNDTYPVSKLATETYAQAANTLLRSSSLNRTKLTLNTNGIAEDLKKQFPELMSVVVTVPIVGNRPLVYVAPSVQAFNLQTERGLYAMDAKGYVFTPLTQPTPDLMLLTDTSKRNPTNGKQYLATSIVTFCSTVAYELHKGGITLNHLDLPAANPYELDAYVSGQAYHIRFNLKADAMQQSGAAVAAIHQLGASPPGEYLDLRVPERAYYK